MIHSFFGEINNEYFASSNKDGSIEVIFKGSIYNQTELEEKLKIPFKSTIDILIYTAYLKWGNDLIKHIYGVFSLCLIDKANQELIIYRDIYGQFPIYYYLNKDFFFADDLELIKGKINSPETNIIALNHFLCLGYVLTPHTFLKDVYIIPPSHYLVYNFKQNKISISKYFNLIYYLENKHNDTLDEMTYKIHSYMNKVIEDKVSSHSEGLLFSGGLDSSIIAYHMRRVVEFKTYTAIFQNKENESEKLLKTAKLLGVDMNLLNFNTIENSDLKSLILTTDQIIADNALYPLYKLTQMASVSSDTIFSGDGADEFFGGYLTYRADRINNKINFIIPLLKSLNINKLMREKNDQVGLSTKINRFLKGIDKDYRKAHFNWRSVFSTKERILLLGENNAEVIMETDPFHNFINYYSDVEHLEKVDQHLYVDCKTWLADNILVKGHIVSKHTGVTFRLPFLDVKLTEYVASCPSKYKVDKLLLKEAYRKHLPDEIIQKRKKGFNSPVSKWFSTEENEFKYYTNYIYKLKFK